MKSGTLNENDKKLIGFCVEARTTRQIAEYLGIAVKNVIVRLKKLEEMGLIEVHNQGKGRTTIIRTKANDLRTKYTFQLLKEIKDKEGVSLEEYSKILDFKHPHDSLHVTTMLPLIRPKLIEVKYFITPEGEKLLEEYSKHKEAKEKELNK